MNITFLIGNGFDLNLNLDTKYQSFCKQFLELEPENEISKAMKKAEKLWSDLEFQLGLYLAEVKTDDDVKRFVQNKLLLEKRLLEYISNENDRFRITDEKALIKVFIENVSKFYTFLPEIEQQHYRKIENDHTGAIDYQFISFNYTNTLDKIISAVNKNTRIFSSHVAQHTTYNDSLKDPLHIHGNTTLDAIFGVNDISQIGNEELRNNESIVNCMLKPILNRSCGNLKIEKAQRIIDNSMYVCVFGMSLGDTDNMWWQHIIKWLASDTNHRVIIFTKDDDVFLGSATSRILNDITTKDAFLKKKNNLKDEIYKTLKDQIFVIPNSKIFDLQGISVYEKNKTYNGLRKAAEKKVATEQVLNKMKNEWDNESKVRHHKKEEVAEALNAQ